MTSPPPAAATLFDTALEWVVRLHSGHANADDQAAYVAWQQADPEARRAAAAAERLWNSLGPALQRPARRRTRRRVATALAVAGFSAAAVLGSGLAGPPSALLADQRTGTGELRTLTLADGSRLSLDAGTAVDIDFTPQQRRLRLIAGQVHVQVAPDAARPFEVEATGGSTRALGTAFQVNRDDASGAVAITVTEHSVRVRGPADPAGGGVTAAAGQQVRYGADGHAQPAATADTDSLTAWRRGRIVFVDRPLGEVVTELRRHRPGFIVLRGDALAQLAVTGAFDSRDTEGVLQALEATLPVRVRRLPWLTVIEPAPAAPGAAGAPPAR